MGGRLVMHRQQVREGLLRHAHLHEQDGDVIAILHFLGLQLDRTLQHGNRWRNMPS